MKKVLYFAALGMTLLAACNKETAAPEEPQAAPKQVVLNFTPVQGDATKAVKNDWEAGDVIFLFFQNITNGYMKMMFNGIEWSWGTVLTSGQNLPLSLSGKSLTAVHLPFMNDADPELTSTPEGNMWHFPDSPWSYYLCADRVPYTMVEEGNTLVLSVESGCLRMAVPDGFVQFYADMIVDDHDYTYDCMTTLQVSHVTPRGVDLIGTDGLIYEKNHPEGSALPGYEYGSGHLYSGVLASLCNGIPTNYEFVAHSLSFDTRQDRTVYASIEGTLRTSGKSGRAVNITGLDWNTHRTYFFSWPMYYKIGSETEVWFSTMNLGANILDEAAQTESGQYFAWGEVEGHKPDPAYGNKFLYKNFSWEDYKWGSSEQDIHKYLDSSSSVLEPEDDAAHVWLGLDWRMPTAEEWQGLLDYCDWTWIEELNSFKVVGRGEYSAHAILLPAVGVGFQDHFYPENTSIAYWSSSLDEEDCDYAQIFWSQTTNLDERVIGVAQRYFGLPIRPVRVFTK